MNKKSVGPLAIGSLCIGCGTCVSLCPTNALTLSLDQDKGVYLPAFDSKLCIDCSLCSKVCPRTSSSISYFNQEFIASKPANLLLGNYLDCFTGYAADHQIRFNSSSGGLVTQLLLFALDEGIIDGALVLRMSKTDPLNPEPFIARTKEEIIEASGSKYCPAPVNLALTEILKQEGKYAVVGLPCQIQGIRRAEENNPKLKKRIVLHLGLFCSHAPNKQATALLLERMAIKESDVLKLDYRGEGWPGFMRITLKNGKVIKVPLAVFWSFLGLDLFISNGCRVCSDALGDFSDISFGDAWLPQFKNSDSEGTSIGIVRNDVGKALLGVAKTSDKFCINSISPKKVIQSQPIVLYHKKKNIVPRMKFLKQNISYENVLAPNFLDYFYALFFVVTCNLFGNKIFKRCLKRIPVKVFNLYYLVPNVVRSKLLLKNLG